jgi:hypothetical protein
VVDEASRDGFVTAGLNLLFFGLAIGSKILRRGLEALYLLGHFLVHYVAAGMHQGIVEPVIEPFLIHGTETGVMVQDKPGLDVCFVCVEAHHTFSRMCYPSAG